MTTKLVYSAVAIPGEPDYDGEILTESEIQYAAHKFMSDYRIIDPEHVCALTNECINVGTPVESTILREPITVKSIHEGKDMNLPKGTWILGIEVTDDREWERIVTGEATGLSLTAARTTVKSRVLIRDLGKNWEAKTVSIVKDPAVPKAKFFQIIGDGMMNDEATKSRLQGFFDKIEEAVKNFKAEEDITVDEAAPEPIQEETVVAETVEEDASIKSEPEAEAIEEEAEPATEVQEEEIIEEVDEEKTEEDIVEEEVVATESEEAEEAVKFVTADELQQTKEEILEAVQTLMQPATEDEAVKSEPEEEEEEEEEETSKVDDEDLDEIRKKDLQIAELEKKIEVLEAKLKTANKSRSKGIPAHFNTEKRAVKNLYEDDNRDLYGRVIRR